MYDTPFATVSAGRLATAAQPRIAAVDICFALALVVAATMALLWAENAWLASLSSDEAREAVRAALWCGLAS
jgi:hypothetical protein